MRVSSLLFWVVVFCFLFISKSVASLSSINHNDLTCLARNIYFEARGESIAGMMAVGLVVRNRKEDSKFPNTYCGVVKQARIKKSWKGNLVPVKHRCQFSWYCDGKPDIVRDSFAYKLALFVAQRVMNGLYDFTGGATHYHSTAVKPKWMNHFVRVAVIGNHVFYKRV